MAIFARDNPNTKLTGHPLGQGEEEILGFARILSNQFDLSLQGISGVHGLYSFPEVFLNIFLFCLKKKLQKSSAILFNFS